MSRKAVPVLLLSLAALAMGCEEKKQSRKNDDALTIVVEADKTRLAEQEAALAERTRSIEAENEKLQALYQKVEAAQGEKAGAAADPQTAELAKMAMKLIKDRQEIDAQQKSMIKEQSALIQKVTDSGHLPVVPGPAAAPAAPAQGPAVAELAKVTGQVAGREKELATRERSLAEREASLAEREKGLAQREAALATRDSACASAAAASAGARKPSGPGLDKAAVEKAYKALLARMAAKGVLATDLPAAKQKAFKDAGNFGKGELAASLEAIEQVEATVDAIAIDGPFVNEKANRVNALQRSSKNAKAKDEVNRLLSETARAYSDGRFAEANRALNNIVHLLEKP